MIDYIVNCLFFMAAESVKQSAKPRYFIINKNYERKLDEER